MYGLRTSLWAVSFEISTEEIESFFHFLREQNKSDSTIHLYYVSLRFFYRLNNVTDRMPSLNSRESVQSPHGTEPREGGDDTRQFKSLKYKTVFTLAYASGLRISELRNLTLADIDFDRKQVYVRRGKNGRNRYSSSGTRPHNY